MMARDAASSVHFCMMAQKNFTIYKDSLSLAEKMLVLLLAAVCGVNALFAEETHFTLGGRNGWPEAQTADGITSGTGRFGWQSIELATNARTLNSYTDLLVSFEDVGGFRAVDTAGNYTVVSNTLVQAGSANVGKAAALSRGESGGLVLHAKPNALFGSSGYMGSFTIEFWLSPSIAENGEKVFSWRSSRNVNSYPMYQMITASFFSNHLEWDFTNVFSGYTQDKGEIKLISYRTIIPDKWAFHQISFDDETGLLEYKIDGQTEALRYITATGRENGSIFSPVMGVPADIEICSNYTGCIDDFRILRCPERMLPEEEKAGSFYGYDKYKNSVGRFVSQPILTSTGSVLNSISALTSIPDQTDVRFYVRAGDNHFNWTDSYPAWKPVAVGERIEGVAGLYLQLAMELFTDGSQSKTPSVTSVTLNYQEKKPPLPPFGIHAVAGDGTVTVSWQQTPDETAGGYFVWYGTRPGEYLGRAAVEGASPVDARKESTITLTGLENGRIYYFAVSSYAKDNKKVNGILSEEVWARPAKKSAAKR